MNTNIPRAVIETAHRDGGWHQWVFIPGWKGNPITMKRSALGRRHPHAWRDWIVVMCNNSDCPARALVPAEALTDIAQSALPVPVEPGKESDQ